MNKKDVLNIGLSITIWVLVIKWIQVLFKKRITLNFYSQRNIYNKPKLIASFVKAKAKICSNKIKYKAKGKETGYLFGQVLRLEKSATEENYFISQNPGLYQKISPNGFLNLE